MLPSFYSIWRETDHLLLLMFHYIIFDVWVLIPTLSVYWDLIQMLHKDRVQIIMIIWKGSCMTCIKNVLEHYTTGVAAWYSQRLHACSDLESWMSYFPSHPEFWPQTPRSLKGYSTIQFQIAQGWQMQIFEHWKWGYHHRL